MTNLKHFIHHCCRTFFIYVGLVSMLANFGCSKAEERMEWKGEITLDGIPLENVTLILTPKGKGQVVAATVVAGKFYVPKPLGPTPGVYSVRINPVDGNDDPVSLVAGLKAGKKKQLIPKSFQSDGKLSVSVTGPPGKSYQFDLKSTER